MAPPAAPQLLLTLMVLVARWSDFGSGTPMVKAVHGVWHEPGKRLAPTLSRSVRSFTEESPCVTIAYLTKLKTRFVQSLDHNNDGLATFAEVKDYLRKFKANIKDTDVQAFINRRDLNGDGAIDLVPEYLQDMTVPDYSIGGASEWFQLQDTDEDGFVSEAELVDSTKALGIPPEEAASTIDAYYMAADVDNDGMLSFDEFKTLYNQ